MMFLIAFAAHKCSSQVPRGKEPCPRSKPKLCVFVSRFMPVKRNYMKQRADITNRKCCHAAGLTAALHPQSSMPFQQFLDGLVAREGSRPAAQRHSKSPGTNIVQALRADFSCM